MALHLMNNNKKKKKVEILVQSKMGMQKNTLPHKWIIILKSFISYQKALVMSEA